MDVLGNGGVNVKAILPTLTKNDQSSLPPSVLALNVVVIT